MCLRSQWASVGVISTRAPAREGGTGSGRKILGQVQEGSCSGASALSRAWPIPSPCLPRWTSPGYYGRCPAQTGEWDWRADKGFQQWWDCLAQEAERAEKEQEQISNWVRDLLDQTAYLRNEIGKMEWELNQFKEKKEGLEVSGLSHTGLVVASSVSGESQGASAGPSAPKKKKKGKQKRHPGLSLEEKQEYYKSYLSHL